ncbi:MAG: hypothetical protein HY292_08755 [Planctomycetes bacterium]|nr:hypothetical protein [Planctomycetota bacterium]
MTPEMLIVEGRRLVRPCVFLRPTGPGPVAAVWHDRDAAEIADTGHRCWITVDARFVPRLSNDITGYLSIFTDEKKCEGGRIEVHAVRPNRPGIELHASEESVLPPIDAIFARGSDAVGDWLADNDWSRDERYNDNFRDRAIVNVYEREWFNEYPPYRQDDTYAVLGGWHWPGADDDWHRMIDEQLLVFTVHDSEPWVEGWRMQTSEFRVIQRIT